MSPISTFWMVAVAVCLGAPVLGDSSSKQLRAPAELAVLASEPGPGVNPGGGGEGASPCAPGAWPSGDLWGGRIRGGVRAVCPHIDRAGIPGERESQRRFLGAISWCPTVQRGNAPGG